jgi:PTS system mannose-specific IIC component
VTPLLALGLLAWGSIVALDLITLPQGLLSRPLVAATLAGAMAGDVVAGMLVGAVLELYNLEVVPIGASRYPDYGPGAVAAGAAAALIPAAGPLGLAGLVGLPLGVLGGWSIHRHRRDNARRVGRSLDQLAAGDARVIWHLQREGLWHDACRGLLLSAVGLAVAWAVSLVDWRGVAHRDLLDWAVLAGGLTAGLGGAIRMAGSGARRRWLALGLLSGIVVAAWR